MALDKSIDRAKALDMALGNIDKTFGKGSIMKMGEKGGMRVETISTGALTMLRKRCASWALRTETSTGR